MKTTLRIYTRLIVATLALGCASQVAAQNPHLFPSGSGTQNPSTTTMGADENKMGPTKGAIGQTIPAAKGPHDNPKISSKDTVFLKQAAAGGLKEVEMGRMAQKDAQSADVKSFGRVLVSDHTKLNNDIMKLAREEHIQLPGAPQLPDMKGSTFDKDFLHMAVEAHSNDIKLFEGEAKNGDQADIKALAQKALPTLREHLRMAKTAQQKVGTTDSTMRQ